MWESCSPQSDALQQHAVHELKGQLFRLHSPDEYGVAPTSERVVRSPVNDRLTADQDGEGLKLVGGLPFRLGSAQRCVHFAATLMHARDDRWTVFIRDNDHARTVAADEAPFHMLGVTVFNRVQRMRSLSAP